jgi:hypothetical protein
MKRYKTQVEFNGRAHESYRDAATVEGAARQASKAWYLSGVSIQANGEGKDLTGPYHRFLLTCGQSFATCRVYT